jgi:hypothetical protein
VQQDERGYWYTPADLPTLLTTKYYPEQPPTESAILRDFLNAHGLEYDRYGFSVRVGQGIAPDPEHLQAIQQLSKWLYAKRIDLLLYSGRQPTICEAKHRLTQSVLGQLYSYRALWVQDNPDEPEPRLFAIGRWIDPDMQRVLSAHGVDVYLYELAGS